MGRNQHSAVLYGREMFIWGGDNTGSRSVRQDIWEDNSVHALNIDTHVWRRIQKRGKRVRHLAGHSAIVVGDAMYIFGGENDVRLPRVVAAALACR